jgi:nucleolar protein 56
MALNDLTQKALFRALKTKGNTPKYGLIYHSTFIGRAATKNKGRISRFLANKCSIASRIDHFIDTPTAKYGEVLRDQVEERLAFYESGVTPRTNAIAMAGAIKSASADEVVVAVEKVGGKRKAETSSDAEVEKKEKKAKKAKKEKKSKKEKVVA